VVPATEVIAMHVAPATVRTRKDSSIVVSAQLVRDGKADAMTSAGNTGATMAAALLRMGRIKGVARPAIAVPIPIPGRAAQILVDGGATVDCTPEWLRQFAVMGREYARIHQNIDEPRIGLLSNGEEAGKGDDLRKSVHALLASMPGFIGNVEGRDFMHDTVDVIVTDGFTGNVALKSIEGTAKLYTGFVRDAFRTSTFAKIGYLFASGAWVKLSKRVDPRRYNGGVFLGLDGICVKSHGGTDQLGFAYAIGVARDLVRYEYRNKLVEGLAKLRQVTSAPDAPEAALQASGGTA
jgi:glycerol-3-phosphate acyltransferase PlsX